MTARWVLGAWAAAAGLAISGCSSSPPPEYQPPQGALIPGTAEATIGGDDAGTTTSVQCMTIGPLTMISTGGENTGSNSGMYAMVSNAEELQVRLLRIKDLGGFTGSYDQGIQGEAAVTMTDRTYDIDGTAAGFDNDNPSFRTTSSFHVKIAC